MTVTTKKNRGRPRSFDREALLKQVMDLFWERGYNPLSFNEIAQATGLTRASLYHAFKTKEVLFTETLDFYFSNSPDARLRMLKPGDSVAMALWQTLQDAIKMYKKTPKSRGCFGVNCMNELMGEGSELGRYMHQKYRQYQQLFQQLVQQAIDQEELPTHINVDITANLLLAFFNGFSVFSKSNTSQETMKQMAVTFLYNLGFSLQKPIVEWKDTNGCS